MQRAQFGVMYTQLEDLVGPVELAQKAEAWGYDSFFAPDFALEPCLDPLVLLAAVAQGTARIRLGTGVLVIPYRHPLALAKAAATLDRLSAGRLILGVGVGGRPREFEAMGLDLRERGGLAEEKLSLLRRFLAGERVTHQGRYHQFTEIALVPRPVQRPHPPIWTGPVWRDGFAPAALSRTARLADGFLPTIVPAHGYRQAQASIRRHAERHGRDIDGFTWGLLLWICLDDSRERAWRVMLAESARRAGTDGAKPGHANAVGTEADCIATIEEYVELGVSHIVIDAGTPPERALEQHGRFAEGVLPHFGYRASPPGLDCG